MNGLEDIRGMKRNESMARHTTMRVGGPAEWFLEARTTDDAVATLRVARVEGLSCIVLGRGSNVIVADQGIKGLVIVLATHEVAVEGDRITADAGISLGVLANEAFAQGLVGIEFLPSIPGSLGGAVRGNAGCWGSETKDVISSVTVLDERGNVAERSNDDCAFGYRHSIFKENNEVVLRATLHLRIGDVTAARQQMLEWVKHKNTSQPTTEASSGCIFKNPDPATSGGKGAGQLIDEAGLKGKMVGPIKVSERHGNFLVNTGGGTADEIMQMISVIKQKVRVQHGVQLMEEVQLLGF